MDEAAAQLKTDLPAQAKRDAASTRSRAAHGAPDPHQLLENVHDAVFALNREWKFTYLNSQAENLLARKREALLGRCIWDEFPQAVGTQSDVEYHRAMDDGVSTVFEQFYPPLGKWFEARAFPFSEGIFVYFRDITLTHEATDALRRSQEDLKLSVDAARLGTFYCEFPLDKVIWNQTCKEHFFLPPDAEVDIALFYSLLHPDDREPTRQAMERAMAERDEYNVEYRTVAPDGRTRWINAVGRFYYRGDGSPYRFDGITMDISARKAAEQAALDAHLRTETILNSVTDSFITLDRDWRFTYINDQASINMNSAREEVVGRLFWDLYPHLAGSVFDTEYRRAFAENVPVSFETYYEWRDVWYEVRAYPSPEGLSIFYRNVTERKRVEEALQGAHAWIESLLNSISDAFIVLDSDWRFTYVNDQANTVLTSRRDELIGRNLWEAYPHLVGSRLDDEYRRAVSENVAVFFENYYPSSGKWFEIRAYPWQGGLSVFFTDITVRKRLEEASERHLAEQEARLRQEALLGRIGAAIRSSLDPDTIQKTAAEVLGEALGADRCLYFTYNVPLGEATVGPDYYRQDLFPLAGQYRISDFRDLVREVFKGQGTGVIRDISEGCSPAIAQQLEAFGHRAVLAVPFHDGGQLIAALWVSMADTTRDWTSDEVSLVEQTATMTRTALEAALIGRREHAIAQQLQEALQPDVPKTIPGFAIGHVMQPALDEAQIGGDFYDVFPLDKQLYAIVIGDVSGKGLAAAQQLALMRNSLRTALYMYRDPVQTSQTVNMIVTSHDLLGGSGGFVTAWIGVVDAAAGIVRYCSCGHVPVMVRRTNGSVDLLESTGLPLGIIQTAEYVAGELSICKGEVLFLCTDGLTESGQTRSDMLEVDGVSNLLVKMPFGGDSQGQAESIVEYARNRAKFFRDDVAVLLMSRL